ncbi:chemotaxis response regulator protein-glutamate methylesterase [Candidatus Endobugula sertula]|uniref:Protein-glutamate methylesterase/protein-glutamine glutaminase n=1 Tax=Candidatus Endobugula sertula TaxID=62101 RepID=A0A1D2QQ48_9GAMM|nr:chemotaxis response regulator protein-glutamate methylesterase [Candidatus Endobugula sertula]
MALNILVVDDSPFFQKLLAEMINEHPRLQVVGFANNGQEAIEQVKSLKPDLVTMDYEMPLMDGVTAVRLIMEENPLPILMLSSMTFPDAKITIDALQAGAADFITKNFSAISNKSEAITQHLHKTLLAIGENILQSKNALSVSSEQSPPKRNDLSGVSVSGNTSNIDRLGKDSLFESSGKPKIVAIGASTGGPAALISMLKEIPASFLLPIVIVQHMPKNFTLAFSERLNRQCNIEVKQASDGDKLLPGRALLAPGGKQLIINKKDATRVSVIDSDGEVNYKPCIDISFASLSNTYGATTLAIVLTGMGNDGCKGAKLLKAQRATVWTQDKDSCVVYGMPMAVDQARLSNASLTLSNMSTYLSAL